MHGRSSPDFPTPGEVTKDSMDLVTEIEAHGSGDGTTKAEIKVTASGVVQE